MLPFMSLNAATATGPGDARDLEGTLGDHGLIVVATGGPSMLNVALEGSHDDVAWTTLATASGASPAAIFVADKAVRYVRANLTVLTGGTSPTVTATIASV